ncbi:hypothetical protein P389DRAFT_207527 [Cystobasidium minutum MCA 4210]|uniref:uncharacterized protein n=1 Tax=Cystobasidium minutum MCA 4210 TaxID=1397322 RepID=UPI0034CF92A2|eukprot:jgi/Rhomi1/207527/estExt_Genemark1.C_1_t10443
MKRALDDDSANNELEEGEEYEEHHPIAGPSTFTLPPPPPPPPLLRLVVHHSSQNPSANLLPPHQTLALIQETTTIGRDKSYEPRIRLKTLEVSRTHATIFQQEEQAHSNQYSDGSEADSSDDTGNWFIVDNASTHGTTIKVANQRFIVHLHGPGDITCESCSVNEDRSNLIPLLESEGGTSRSQGILDSTISTGHTPMNEHEAKTFTKEEKRQNFRSNMQSLRKNLLTGGGSSSSSRSAPQLAKRYRTQDTSRPESVNNSGDDSNLSASEVEQQPRYVDRAKLRRSIHPPQHGLSDADPPHLSKRSKVVSPPARPIEPSYGPGAALFQKMLSNSASGDAGGNVDTNVSGGSGNESATSVKRSEQQKEVKMGKVIEVRTMAERSAGLGSGAIREGVEQHASPVDWKVAARQRRWREANR